MPLELLLTAGLVLTLDQLSKAWVVGQLGPGRSLLILPGLHLRLVKGGRIGRGRGVVMLFGLWLLVFGVILASVQVGELFPHPTGQAGLGAALGGAAGNLWDRWQRGAVLDFFDLGWWPVFNVADVAITLGVPIALWFIF